MNGQAHEPVVEPDGHILELAALALSDAGYSLEQLVVEDVPMILGENPDNVVVVTATATIDELVGAEAVLSRFLVDRLSEAPSGGKRWDAYVAVFTRQSAEMRANTLFGLTYNLRHVRRILKVGVEPTLAGVSRALRALLPLSLAGSISALDDPLEALARQLMSDGIEEELVNRAIRQFRSSYVRSSVGVGEADDTISDQDLQEQEDD